MGGIGLGEGVWGNTTVCKGKALRKKNDDTAAKRHKELSIDDP